MSREEVFQAALLLVLGVMLAVLAIAAQVCGVSAPI
jgi:hypothetical protein